MGRLKKDAAPGGAPEWLVTYGDMVTLLLCFFVLLVSMSEVKKDQKFDQVMESLRDAFGGWEGSLGKLPLKDMSANTLIQKLLEIEASTHHYENKSETEVEGLEGKKFRVTNVRSGLQVVIGGLISFERFSAALRPEGQELIAKTAARLRGYNTKIQIRGHATREPLPDDSVYEDARDLSYARAKAVADELVQNGLSRSRLLLVAVGDSEPLVRQAYTEQRRALNRRVELIVTEDLVDDFAGSTTADDLKETFDGG